MKLLTKALRKQIPPRHATEDADDPVVQAKFFTPDSNWTWYVLEFDGENLFFGLMVGHDPEMDTSHYRNWNPYEDRWGCPERDLHFEPTRLSTVKEQVNRLRRE